jgi:long-chain acyl-CoA synthetase
MVSALWPPEIKHGPKACVSGIFSPPLMPTFYDQFVEAEQRGPQNIALEIQRKDQVESYTFAESRKMAESVGRWMSEKKLPAGTRVAILADNHPRWVATYLGIIASGYTAVPLDTAFHADQVTKLLKDSGASLLVTDVKHLHIAQEAVSGMRIELILTDPASLKSAPEKKESGKDPGQPRPIADLDTIFAAGPGNFRPLEAPAENVAALLYTSGTTADPKGVELTHANLLGEVDAVFRVLNIGPTDAVLGILPMFHVLAQMANLLLPLVKGARVVYLETLNTTELLRALQERQITAFAVVPQFFYLIHERIFKEVGKRGRIAESILRYLMRVNRFMRKLHLNAGKLFFGKIHATFGTSMRYLITGGSRFDPVIARDFHDFGIDLLNAYGLTETSAAAFLNRPGHVMIGSVGPPLPTIESKILDPQPSEEGGSATGEILIRGPIVMKGYWNRPDATAEAIKDGWLHTGDLGYFDSGGNLFITGRSKELIVLANGKNIYPEEIEGHYLKSPFIKELCVMGLEVAGDPNSERLYAVVVPNFDVLKERKVVNAKEVIRFDIEGLSQQLPSTKRIGNYEIWQDDLPRTTTRKLKRFEIEKRARANQARGSSGAEAEVPVQRPMTPEDEAWLEKPEVEKALTVIRENSRNSPEKIHPADNLELDLGFDSMQRVELLVAVEKELGGDVEESQLADIYTVRDLVNAVLESAASGKTISRARFAGWNAVLRENPEDPDVLDLARPAPLREAFWYFVSRVFQVVFRDRFSMKYEGLEKLPAKNGYILSSNHQSYLDPAALASLLPHDAFVNSFAVGTSEIFGAGFMRKLARSVRVVVVDPDANLIPAMKAGAYGLRHGRNLVLYPEGERSIDGTPRTFKKGAAILSIHMQVPIVPIAIEGFYDAWPRGKRFQKFAPLKMKFGDPIYPPPESEASEEAYAAFIAKVKDQVVEMWKELRGEADQDEPHSKAAD